MRKAPEPLNLAISRREPEPYDHLVLRNKRNMMRYLYFVAEGGSYAIGVSAILLAASVFYGFLAHDFEVIIVGGIASFVLLPLLLATGMAVGRTKNRIKSTLERIERLPLDEGLPLSESLVRASEQPVEEHLLRGASSGKESSQDQLLRAVDKSEE